MNKSLVKISLFTILMGVLLISLVACNNSAKVDKKAEALPKEINFGILRVPNDETIAMEEGFFDKYFTDKGIKCNYIVFDSGSEANKALASGSIDFATMGDTNAVTALSKKLGVELIWIHEVLGKIEALAVKNGSGINKLSDLAGRKVATPFASTSHYSLLNALKDAAIEDQVQLLNMKTAEIVAAWQRGDIEAAYTWQPSLGKLLQDGKMLINSQQMAEKGYITANVEVVRKEFAKQYPYLVTSFIACLSQGADIYRQDPQKAAKIEAEKLGITAADALQQMQGSVWHTPEDQLGSDLLGSSKNPGAFATVMKSTSDFLQKLGFLDESPSQEKFNQYVNPSFIEKYLARKEDK